MSTKRCSKCGEVKPLQEFYAHPEMADGRLNKCKDCTKRYSKAWRHNDHARLLAYDRARGANPLYAIRCVWRTMIARCHNPRHRSYPEYGGRGVIVCERWRESFDAFLADMGMRPTSKHSLDRFPEANGNYGPGNVRWATPTEQARNRRSNRMITHEGITRCAAEWAEQAGVPLNRFLNRLARGWSVARALSNHE